MNGWVLFFVILGVIALTTEIFRFIDWVEGK
jgi:hypothetical protein